jgi:hypothetical protein
MRSLKFSLIVNSGIVSPPVLKSIGMNAGIVAITLLILCSSIERPSGPEEQVSTQSWDKLPDLEYMTGSNSITSSTENVSSSVSRRPSRPDAITAVGTA